MSLSRSPSPNKGGGWSSPGLTTNFDNLSGRSTPRKGYGEIQMNGAVSGNDVSWTTAKARSDRVNGYPWFETRHDGFFTRHARQMSRGLPSFVRGGEKEKLGRGRWYSSNDSKTMRFLGFLGRSMWRMRLRLLVLLSCILALVVFYVTRKRSLIVIVARANWMVAMHRVYRRASLLGGGSKFVIILAANQGGGVMEWKGPREWAIERDSVKNKKKYAKKWGYNLEIVDMSTKKRYAHEWRESWEKVDTIRNCMRKYPHAQW